MAKTLEERIAKLETRVIELQAGAIHQAAAETALLKLVEALSHHAGKKTYWHRSCAAAFKHLATDARARLLERLNSHVEAAFARQVAHALKDI
jgi:hypothetical protein